MFHCIHKVDARKVLTRNFGNIRMRDEAVYGKLKCKNILFGGEMFGVNGH